MTGNGYRNNDISVSEIQDKMRVLVEAVDELEKKSRKFEDFMNRTVKIASYFAFFLIMAHFNGCMLLFNVYG